MPDGTPRHVTPACWAPGCRSTTSDRSVGRTMNPLRLLPVLQRERNSQHGRDGECNGSSNNFNNRRSTHLLLTRCSLCSCNRFSAALNAVVGAAPPFCSSVGYSITSDLMWCKARHRDEAAAVSAATSAPACWTGDTAPSNPAAEIHLSSFKLRLPLKTAAALPPLHQQDGSPAKQLPLCINRTNPSQLPRRMHLTQGRTGRHQARRR